MVNRLLQHASVKQLRRWHEQYEPHLSAAAVLIGFTIDSLTLRRVDLWAEHIVILSYLAIAGIAIVVMLLYNEGKLSWPVFTHADWWVPLVMQFAFGGLFSVFLLFYGRAGSFAANWPALVILLGLLVGNEFFRRRYRRLTFNITIWYTAVLAYSIFTVPILVNQIGGWVFILSGFVSLAVVWAFVQLLSQISSGYINQLKRTFATAVGLVFVFTSFLYFSHAIPPIPMSLRQGHTAHALEKTAKHNYRLLVEDRRWYQQLIPGQTVHVQPGEPLYFFSAVFAPADFDTEIVHNWQYRQGGDWVPISSVSFPVVGGRAGGYRGYSKKANLRSGRWRVKVSTPGGRQLGQESFRVVSVDTTPNLQTVLR